MTRLSDDLADVPDKWLADADRELRELYPGDPGTRQPVHTVYIPADRFSPDAHRRWGTQAVELLDRHAPTAERLAEVTGMPVPLVYDVYDRFGPNSSASRWKTCEWTSRTATASAPTRRRTGRQARWPPHSPGPLGPRTARPSSASASKASRRRPVGAASAHSTSSSPGSSPPVAFRRGSW